MLKKVLIIIAIVFVSLIVYFLYILNIIPHKKYTDIDFDITTYKSLFDKDNDGVDDQSDILNNTRSYIATKPKYQSKYYATGYPNDEYGTCVDVVAFSLKDAGYDLMNLVNEHVLNNRELYDIDIVDKNIDFRRVVNLNVYFKETVIVLTNDINKIEDWQGGDIVVFKNHIGIVSDKRNKNGVPFVIHHANKYQIHYEEDILEKYEVIGHYRIS